MSDIDLEEKEPHTSESIRESTPHLKWKNCDSWSAQGKSSKNSNTKTEPLNEPVVLHREKELSSHVKWTDRAIWSAQEKWPNQDKWLSQEKWSNHDMDVIQTKLGASLAELMTHSSVHGLAHVFRVKSSCMRYFWLISFLFSLFFCTWLIVQTFTQYFAYKVITQVKIVNEIPTEFPKLTICNKNFATSDYGYQVSAEIYQRMYGSSLGDKKDNANLDTLLDKLKMAVNKYSSEEKQKWGHAFSQMVLSCSFSQKPCDQSDFEWMYHAEYGNCFVFNTGRNSSTGAYMPIKQVHNTGSKYGLSVDLFVGISEAWEKFYESTGAVLLISNKTFLAKKAGEIVVSPGVQTKISVTRTHLHQKPMPYSNCSLEAENSYSYTQQECMYQCLQKRIEEACDCFSPEFIPLLKEYSCYDQSNETRALQSVSCADNVTESFFTGNTTDECKLFCPLECNRVLYSYSSSISDSLSRKKAELQYLDNQVFVKTFGNVTFDKIKKSIVKLSVYYDDLSYTEIKENESMDVAGLLAHIGGIMALFLGSSLLSFVEAVGVLHEIMSFLVHRKNTSKVTFKNLI